MKKIFLAVIMLALLAMAEEEKKECQVKEITPFWYCAVEMTGSYEKHAEAFQTLYEQASMQGLGSDFAAFGVYYSDPSQIPEAELKWEVGFALEKETELKAPLVLKKWDYNLLASTLYEGAFSSEGFGAAHQKLFEWVMQNNYAVAGPMMEKYLDMPRQNSNGEWQGKIDIMLPVQKK